MCVRGGRRLGSAGESCRTPSLSLNVLARIPTETPHGAVRPRTGARGGPAVSSEQGSSPTRTPFQQVGLTGRQGGEHRVTDTIAPMAGVSMEWADAVYPHVSTVIESTCGFY